MAKIYILMGQVVMNGDDDDEWSWTRDWRDPYDDMNEEEKKCYRQSFYDIEMHEIENSSSRDDFYNRISDIIKRVHDFNDQQVTKLSDIIQKQWKPKRGASTKEGRDYDIWFYWVQNHQEGNNITRKQMIEYIMTEYKVTADAATKIFNKIK